MPFTDEQIRLIRTADVTDAYLARLLKARTTTVRNCRVGITYPDHAVPPDTKPRAGGGRYAGKAAHRRK